VWALVEPYGLLPGNGEKAVPAVLPVDQMEKEHNHA
jgi:hypothetical protein